LGSSVMEARKLKKPISSDREGIPNSV